MYQQLAPWGEQLINSNLRSPEDPSGTYAVFWCPQRKSWDISKMISKPRWLVAALLFRVAYQALMANYLFSQDETGFCRSPLDPRYRRWPWRNHHNMLTFLHDVNGITNALGAGMRRNNQYWTPFSIVELKFLPGIAYMPVLQEQKTGHRPTLFIWRFVFFW